jgi:hypothetical protein
MKHLKGSQLSVAVAIAVSHSYSIPNCNGMYEMRPKNYFRGGSVGKGGKIKYRRN